MNKIALILALILAACGISPDTIGEATQDLATVCNPPLGVACYPWLSDNCSESCPNYEGHCPEYDWQAIAWCSDPAHPERRNRLTCALQTSGPDCDPWGNPCWSHVCVSGPAP